MDSQRSVQSGRQRCAASSSRPRPSSRSGSALIAAYSYTDPRCSSNDRNQLGRPHCTPRHGASAWLDYRFRERARPAGRHRRALHVGLTTPPAPTTPTCACPRCSCGTRRLLRPGPARRCPGRARGQPDGGQRADRRYVSHCLMLAGSPCIHGARRTATATLSYAWVMAALARSLHGARRCAVPGRAASAARRRGVAAARGGHRWRADRARCVAVLPRAAAGGWPF